MSLITRNAQLLSLVCFLTLSLTAMADQFVIYTLAVKHRSPESLVAPLQPMLHSGGHISTSGNKLIIKTTPENFQEIVLLVDELDTPSRQLLISVRQKNSGNSSAGGLTTHGNITTGTIRADGQPVTSTKTQSSRNYPTQQTVTVTKSTGWGQGESSYQIRAMEGERVYLQSGQQIPVQSRYGVVGGVASSEYYHPVMSGVSVTARLRNGQVILDLQQEANKVDGRNIDSQSLSTQINVRLGEWVQVSGIQEQGNTKNSAIVSRHATSSQQDSAIYIKVEAY